MTDRVAVLLTVLIAIAGVAFGRWVMDRSWPVTLLLVLTPVAFLLLGLFLKNRPGRTE
jgi:hypothetical protein